MLKMGVIYQRPSVKSPHDNRSEARKLVTTISAYPETGAVTEAAQGLSDRKMYTPITWDTQAHSVFQGER
jgi:hypothetical protein